MTFQDLSGRRFYRLLAIERGPNRVSKAGSSATMWRCKCDCGNSTVTSASNLKDGTTKSCGCYNLDMIVARNTTHGDSERGRISPMYAVWKNILSRCFDPNSTAYGHYGGRGIAVEWVSYSDFKKDMEGSYSPGLEIERKDNDGNYSKDNCCWVTHSQQCKNRRSNVILELDGRKQIMSDWAVEYGINAEALRKRLVRGWTVRDAITKPLL